MTDIECAKILDEVKNSQQSQEPIPPTQPVDYELDIDAVRSIN